ncbi:MAG: hypothetical protein ABWK05_07525 [Pyrobaculum sp.]
MYVQYQRYSPVGEYLRLVIMKRLSQGPAPVEEIDRLAKKAVEELGERYDWRVWPQLLKREVVIKNGTAELTREGKWIYEQTWEEVAAYVSKKLGVPLP